MRTHFSRAAFGNVILCGAWGLLYLSYGDHLQAAGLMVCLSITVAFIFAIKSVSERQIFSYSLILLGVSVVLVSIVLPLGPVLLSYFLPVTQVLISLSKERWLAIKLLLAGVLFPIVLAGMGFDSLLSTTAPTKFALAILTIVASSMAWYTVGAVRKRMVHYMLELRTSYDEIDEQNSLILQQKLQLAATNADLEKITERLAVKAEQEMLITKSLVEKTGDQQSMVQAIHHDLREPLRNIVSFSQLIGRKLSGRPEAQEALEYLAFAKDGGQRMTSMLDDLLRYTKNVEGDMVPIDLNDLLGQLQIDLSDTLRRNRGELKIECLPVVLGLPTQIRQLFQNLISNALKFSKKSEAPVIRIFSDSDIEGLYNIHISDNGIGIPEGQLSSVFKLFSRADNSLAFTGSGVGLSLCKKICLQHGADLEVVSTLNAGSTFSIKRLGGIGLNEMSIFSSTSETP